MTNVEDALKKLGLKQDGHYDNHFYIIELKDSNEYAKMYTLLNKKAVNTEYPSFGTNTSNNTVKVTNYFEIEANGITYNIFLVADFKKDEYMIRIGEQ